MSALPQLHRVPRHPHVWLACLLATQLLAVWVWWRFGWALGLAFQVVDDVLDATEEAAQLGKTAGKDDAAGKATYVRVHGIEAARALAARLREEALTAVAPFGPRGALLAALARMMVDRRA